MAAAVSRRSLPLRGLVGGLVTSLLVVAVGSGAVVASTGASTVVTYAVSPGQTPNQVFPLVAPANAQPAELYYFTAEMYDSLYWYGNKSHLSINRAWSLADLPKFTVVNGHTVATITLKDYDWSDGTPITTRDVEFWMRLLVANKDQWWDYSPESSRTMSLPRIT